MKTASTILPSSPTLICSFITSPHAGAPTSPAHAATTRLRHRLRLRHPLAPATNASAHVYASGPHSTFTYRTPPSCRSCPWSRRCGDFHSGQSLSAHPRNHACSVSMRQIRFEGSNPRPLAACLHVGLTKTRRAHRLNLVVGACRGRRSQGGGARQQSSASPGEHGFQ